MIPETVIDQTTQARYEIVRDADKPRELGRGATAAVYLAHLKSGEGDSQVAVKVAFPGLTASTLADFRAEQEKIERLHAKIEYVPWAHNGVDPAHPDAAIIVLELSQDNWKLASIVSKSDGRLTEGLALKVGMQYADLLVVMHKQLNLTMRGDRKAGDVYWNDKRLIVLDWNRAQELPKVDPKDDKDKQNAILYERNQLIRQDIRIFGQLWAEWMLKHSINSLPEPDDAKWTSPSFGMRVILVRALGNSTAIPDYKDAEQLQAALKTQLDLYQNASSEIKEYLGEAKKELTLGIEGALKAAAIADLLLNAPSDLNAFPRLDNKQKEDTRQLFQRALEEIEKARKAKSQVIDKIKDRFRLEQYRDAVNIALNEIEAIKGQERADALARLKLRRWWMAANLAVKRNEAGKSAKPIADALTPALANWQTTDEIKNRIISALMGLDEDSQKQVQAILLEFDIAPADRQASNVLSNWRILESVDRAYADDLRKSNESLQHQLERLESESDCIEFGHRVESVTKMFTDATEWPRDLMKQINPAWDWYDFHLRWRDQQQLEPVRADYDLLCVLREIDPEMRSPDVEKRNERDALRLIRSLPIEGKWSQVKTKLEQLVLDSALKHLDTIANPIPERMQWRDGIEQGKRLLDEIRHSDLTGVARKFDSDGKLQKDTEERFNKWQGILDRADKFTLVDFMDDLAANSVIGKLKDQLLSDALEARIELFDRNGNQEGEIKVSAIRTLRESLRLEEQIKQYQGEMNVLKMQVEQDRGDLNKLKKQAEADRKALNQRIAEVNQAIETAKTILESAAEKKPEQQISVGERLDEQLVQIANRLVNSQQNLDIQIKKAEADSAEAEDKVKLWSGYCQEMSNAVVNLEEFSKKLKGIDNDHGSFIQNEKQTFDQFIKMIHVTEGFAAIRQLNIENARKQLKAAGEIKSRLRGFEELQQIIETLGDELLFKTVKRWQECLDLAEKNEIDDEYKHLVEAEEARKSLETLFPTFNNSWLAAELYERHLHLVRKSLLSYNDQFASDTLGQTAFQRSAIEALKSIGQLGQSEVSISPGEVLEKIIEKQLDDLARIRFTAFDWEMTSNWLTRLYEVSWIKTRFRDFEFIMGKKISINVQEKLASGYGVLIDICKNSSTEVFFVFYDSWKVELERIAERISDADRIKYIQEWLSYGEKKADRGRRLLDAKLL